MKPTNPVLIATLCVLLSSSVFARDMYENSAMKAIPHTSITFDTGSAMLSESDKSDLKKVVQEAKNKGVINQMTVAAWSDKALPARGQKLSAADRDLANRRAMAISDFLKTGNPGMEVSDVDTFNMAENSNWVARTFNTKGAELKSLFSKKGAERPLSSAEFQVIKSKGGPREAVVVTEMKMQ